MPSSPIAIVGLACVYPDARTPGELWENVLAQRRAFRRIPSERMEAADYWSANAEAPDRTYACEAALIEGYEFDRVGFRVVGSTYRSADLAHWLALDVASRALADAGFADGRGLPRQSTGVLLGNTLTGEFSRANVLRLRWPYVRRLVETALAEKGWEQRERQDFLEHLEQDYKAPFPAVGEETLAGGLSNTIAGRICNQFDLKGGGYTVDGACASSLLAVANACSALASGDLDVALAGGVDLSLDPFELVGFAKTGALAPEEMRVFDRRSAGFWPGEGCGFATLMRLEDAQAQGCRIYAVIQGWGISSDGSGGITRPEADGQLEAIRRAYRRAGFGIDTVAYSEGHGTGTAVGDATELEVLARARREANPGAPPAAVGSVKANLGHCKAAAGIAGLIKATMSVHTQVMPPTTACEQPHAFFDNSDFPLRILREPQIWSENRLLRASVSAMGFGGINAHVVLENPALHRREGLTGRERSLAGSPQDAELFLFAAGSSEQLREQVERVLALAGRLSRSEMTDLAAELSNRCSSVGKESLTFPTPPASQEQLEPPYVGSYKSEPFRAAIVASKPSELVQKLQALLLLLKGGAEPALEFSQGIFLRVPATVPADGAERNSALPGPRIVFLFPGQGSPAHLDGGLWRRRFESVRKLYERARLPTDGDAISTRLAQPAVVTASLAGLTVLRELGLEAFTAVGHSLGEITGLHWAGALNEESLLRVARVRGAAMADLGSPTGAMLAIAAPASTVQELLTNGSLTIVGYNSPRQTVVAGEVAAINGLAASAMEQGIQTTRLPVSHAFHTALVAAAVPVLAKQLANETVGPLQQPLVSTITAQPLPIAPTAKPALSEQHSIPPGASAESVGAPAIDLRELLCRQVTSPVRFQEALASLLHLNGGQVDLVIEVGPGSVLSGLARDCLKLPVVALDAGGHSLKGLLSAVGGAFVLGAPVKHQGLFAERFARPFNLDRKPKFFANPCETGRKEENGSDGVLECWSVGVTSSIPQCTNPIVPKSISPSVHHSTAPLAPPGSPLELVRGLVAQRAELPVSAIQDGHRMLSDLHLNSITVSQLVSEAARRLGLPRVIGLTDFANATVAEIAHALEEIKRADPTTAQDKFKLPPSGVDAWVESFTVELVDSPLCRCSPVPAGSEARKLADADRRRTDSASPGPLQKRDAGLGWRVLAPQGHPLASKLREKFAAAGGSGVVLCLPEETSEDHIGLLLESGRAVTAAPEPRRFVLVQHGWGGSGFARTLHLETPGLTTCIVNVPPAHSQAVEWIVAEALAANDYVEANYDAKGTRREPRLQWMGGRHNLFTLSSTLSQHLSETLSPLSVPVSAVVGDYDKVCYKVSEKAEDKVEDKVKDEGDAAYPIGPGDVILVTGGGKGIAAECALALGQATGAALALMGRSDPETNNELSENLARIAACGLRCCYERADVTDAQAVKAAMATAEKKLGPVTAILHGAGVNKPQLIGALDEAHFRNTVAPKLQGLRNVLAALDAERLRVLVTFGSIIARAGFHGEADYATANEWMTSFTEQFQNMHPRCRCLALEWSVWSGIGMGQRLGRMESLVQRGVTPIAPMDGARIFLEHVRCLNAPGSSPATGEGSGEDAGVPRSSVARVITGRFGEMPTVKMAEAELPLHRFLERKRVHCPGVELIVDAELSLESDLYLSDHVVQKERLLPGVIGLEAMAQAAMALTGSAEPPTFEEVKLARPVVVGAPTVIRLAAMRRSAQTVEVCLRSAESDFQIDHFRATCRFGAPALSGPLGVPASRENSGIAGEDVGAPGSDLPLDPRRDLYGKILFHRGRFCRLQGYSRLTARHCVARISPPPDAHWFGPYLPSHFVLGDPGARDAALHAIQACIPHRRILPTGIDRLVVLRDQSGPRLVQAKERSRAGNDFIYDLEIKDAEGNVIEFWEGLRLRAVELMNRDEAWPEPLLGPYIERRLEELVENAGVSLIFNRGEGDRTRVASDALMQRLLGTNDPIWRRADGKPLGANGHSVSAAHAGDFTLAVAGHVKLGCDLESVTSRTEDVWSALLGGDQMLLAKRIAQERNESLDTAATRLWAARESLKKAGQSVTAPLVLDSTGAREWVLLRSGAMTICTCLAAVRGTPGPLVAAVAIKST